MKKINFKIIAWVIVGLIVAFKLKSCHNRRLATPTQPAAGQTPANGTNKETLPPPTPEPQPQPEYHPTYKGLKYEGKLTAGPLGIYPDDGVVRHWYTLSDDDTEMKMLDVTNTKGLMKVLTQGPVIYDMMIITESGASEPLRIKKSMEIGEKGHVWNWTEKRWEDPTPFSFEEIQNISGIRILRDKKEQTLISAEIGLPITEKK